MSRLTLPVGLERWWVGAAGIMWVGVVVGMVLGWPMAVTSLGLAWLLRRWQVATFSCGLLAVAILVGWMGAERTTVSMAPPDLAGEVALQVDVLADARVGAFGSWILARPVAVEREGTTLPWRGPVGLVASNEGSSWSRGDRIWILGTFVGRSGRAAGDPYAWRMRPDEVVQLESRSGWLVEAADIVRGRIGDSLGGVNDRSAAALVSGFLIGDVRELAEVDSEAMRAAGLSHFVAVSGSNVALFLLVWWVLLAPIVRGPGRRAIGGIFGLALFGLITRWEPSVIRAATMAGLVLIGRAAGVPVTIWTALGIAVSLVLVVAPELAFDVGFQLSVAATVGVVAGSRALVGFGPRWLALPLGVTLAAQVAVAPILLATFGKLPVWSPVANLLAGPLVMAATALGGLGALGVGPATEAAVWIAAVVLKIANAVADLPTVGWFGFIVGLGLIGMVIKFRRLRPILALGGILVVATGLVPRQAIEGPAIVFLDVGQGDAILLIGDDGGTVLIDGGPDPLLIRAALARQGIRRIDLAIVTHADADHLVGILEVVRAIPVGLLWRPDPAGGDPRLDILDDVAYGAGLPIEIPQVGDAISVGGVRLSVIGPLRRYASSNDEGIVVVAEVGELTALLAGDTEATSQREFGMPSVDVLKVPHHGSRTTDLAWLASTDASVAVISVGDNDFGHPTPEVLAVLKSLPLEVRRTDLEGDVVLNG